ncbi:MAG TPA: c-type cytochrome [Blastocatellia bacterium]|nr:c-type cytochrome [Blastocatellia bacterium]HMV84992.1 c-type cytochrome [Blastocatellia bacterium]HMX24779.1 c-type cytochrome [Blastocatellia bacterium]HMY72926.1 c-type cytochrome [Blastocatellia bacterium]HMZ18079.1 c-type cytochrome [Blastocatellia bacterium]
MWKKVLVTIAVGIGIAMFSGLLSVSAQGVKEDRGQKLFMQYCASCHGADGKGGGPVAATLKTAIPNLTTYEKRNGKFDQLRVQNIIAGEVGVLAHGSKEMPVWGYIFRQKAGGNSTSKLNVFALATYIKSIQQK